MALRVLNLKHYNKIIFSLHHSPTPFCSLLSLDYSFSLIPYISINGPTRGRTGGRATCEAPGLRTFGRAVGGGEGWK